MMYDLTMLMNIAENIVSTDNHRAGPLPNPFLKDEVQKLKMQILHHITSLANEMQVHTFLKIKLYHLVNICDLLYDKGQGNNHDAGLVLELILAITTPLTSLVPQDFVLPTLFNLKEGAVMNERWITIVKELKTQDIDPALTEMMGFPFFRYQVPTYDLTWMDYNYLRSYTNSLEKIMATPLNQDQLITTLIQLGFNYQHFVTYCCKRLYNSIEHKTPAQRVHTLTIERMRHNRMERLSALDFDPRNRPIMVEIDNWMRDQIAAIEMDSSVPHDNRLNTTLTVQELSFFQKLLWDHGVYEETNLDIFSGKIAAGFNSKGVKELSAPSIKSKFYTKERSATAPVEKLLSNMLNEVRQFNG